MGKSEQGSDGVPGISPDTEASKLLEAALMQMDGIISGKFFIFNFIVYSAMQLLFCRDFFTYLRNNLIKSSLSVRW